MMIAFATQPGNVALDGEGRNSPFTEALLRHIDVEGASINDVMINVRKDVFDKTNGRQIPWENSSLTGQFYFKPAQNPEGSVAEIAALRAEVERLKANRAALDAHEQQQLASLEEKLEAETGEAVANREIVVEAAGDSPTNDAGETKTAHLDPAALTDTAQPEATPETPEPITEIDQAALRREIQTRLKELNCYSGRVDGDWGRGTRAAMETFNRIAKSELNTTEAEQETLDTLAAWSGETCPAKTIVRRKPAPTPKVAKPKAPAKTQPTYTNKPTYSKKQAYTKDKSQPEDKDYETDTVHRLLRPAR
jgi:Caspase domain